AVAPPQLLSVARPLEEQAGDLRQLGQEGAALRGEAIHALPVLQVDDAVDLAGMAQRRHQHAAAADHQAALPRGEAGILDQIRQIEELAGGDRLADEGAAEPALQVAAPAALLADLELLLV